MTATDLPLPADMRREFPGHMGVRVEEGKQIWLYQHSDCSGGRWLGGWAGEDQSPSGLAHAVTEYSRDRPDSRY